MSLEATSSQTVGPYLHIGLTWYTPTDLAAPDVAGERLAIEGRVVDANGQPVSDAMIEVWQANAAGRYAHPADSGQPALDTKFRGWGRCPTNDNGGFRFATIKPGRVAGPDGRLQAPHINVTIFMRGLLKHLSTRIYFPGEPANAEDPVLGLVPLQRRGTLIAAPAAGRAGVVIWNVVLQGVGETVFFDC